MSISPTIEIFGITLHLYGLIIGIAIVFATTLIEKQYKKLGYPENCFWKIGLFALFFGTIGARLWHVATDFYLYTNSLVEVFYIWNGGLSIFGGILGGILGVYIGLKYLIDCKQVMMMELLDISVFGLPAAQVIGRLGNYINQELYGVPTNFILKIFISKNNRLEAYKSIAYYHPLFFYEMIGMSFFIIVFYYLNKKQRLSKIGSGKLFLTYLLYYSVLRFFLEFIRLDKAVFLNSSLGINQVILILVVIFTSYFLYSKRNNHEEK